MSEVPTTRRGRIIAISAIVALLLAFAAMSWTAVRTKSATADEPLHALGGYMKLFHHDFRLNCEDPPLFAYWAMLPHDASSLTVPTDAPVWQHLLEYLWRQWQWCVLTLYETPGNDADAFLAASRAMMLLLGVILGALLGWWGWKLAGPVAGVAAVALYCFDPNFLGHAPLVKNDVPITLVITGVMMTAWGIGRRATWWNSLLLMALCGIAFNVKFSGLIVAPIVGAALLGRAMLPTAWPAFGLALPSRIMRIAYVVLLGIGCAVSVWLITWASYGFRFSPTPQPGSRFNMDVIVDAAVVGMEPQWRYTHDAPADEAQLKAFAHTPFIAAVQFADSHRLMPHAWLAGLLDTYATTRSRSSYLNGTGHVIGRWEYFPLAMLYKTPTASLLALAGAVLACATLRKRPDDAARRLDRWSLICLVVPLVIYGYSIITSNVNLGLRHALPLYPFIYLLVAAMCARAVRAMPKISTIVAALLTIGLMIESLAAWPNYIAFFNAPSGGSIGGYELLGDSNLDWGQDLLLLKQWKRAHPGVNLYVAYFGMAAPRYYLGDYTPMPGDVSAGADPQLPHAPGVAAVSATVLQGIYGANVDDTVHARYVLLKHTQRPIEVLGGTIYLYEVTPQSPIFVPQ